ncbi:MAG: hypothetical protein CNCCGFBP_00893 [Fimbriimonadaceae bacterium]|nr:hypothetical protein [Fimbriimonadaceae bacterium]
MRSACGLHGSLRSKKRIVTPYLVGKGTALNTATVVVGSVVGLAAGAAVPPEYKVVATAGIGLATLGLGVKMFLETRSVLIVVAAIVLGGVLGLLLRLDEGLRAFAEFAKSTLGAAEDGRFEEGLITASVLFCVGPMTLLGCLQDGLEGKIELLAIKSTLDGFAALFLSATLGAGVLVSALVVLVFQGALTNGATRLKFLARHNDRLAETTAVGGLLLVAIGLGLLEVKSLAAATYLPALVVAPILVGLQGGVIRRWRSKGREGEQGSAAGGSDRAGFE